MPMAAAGGTKVPIGVTSRYKDLDADGDERFRYSYGSSGLRANDRHSPSLESGKEAANGEGPEPKGDSGPTAPTIPKAHRRAKSDPNVPINEDRSNSEYHDIFYEEFSEPSGPPILNSFDPPFKCRSRAGSVAQSS